MKIFDALFGLTAIAISSLSELDAIAAQTRKSTSLLLLGARFRCRRFNLQLPKRLSRWKIPNPP
jgi:hypothetical protein